ncbi:hypothetical protein Riv7116_5187 [Rivularia sp. PCC 7116]|uniref:hypothetical protein n=1 Tax=Rivularia sp. PCC 7116 TaxID=373994 RepID=UPI00029EE458|nr:hypothetical protein [Rivularia sp. PCC 7116]AFY57583.1 hypothetical protein Riv7116_5187 [Rivularia sp. PCC 7116]
MKLIQYQANVLWDNLSSPNTAKIYQQALVKTWNLLKETAILLLMLLLLVVVFVLWVWHIGFTIGWKFRQWMESPNKEPEKLVENTIKSLVNSFAQVFNWVKNFAKKRLGLELPESEFKFLQGDSQTETNTNKQENSESKVKSK